MSFYPLYAQFQVLINHFGKGDLCGIMYGMNVGMKTRFFALLSGLLLPFAAFGAYEGTPVYYQNSGMNANQANYGHYQRQGYTQYVGQNGQKQVVGTNNYVYQVPRANQSSIIGTMTPNGVAMPAASEAPWILTADYTRRFADFKFETGVNSVLEWDDMLFNEIGVHAQHNFNVRDYDLFAYGEYRFGTLAGGGMSMDYDLKPYDEKYPDYGIFTISMGDMSGRSSHMRFGMGARHVWDIAGWKLSPSIGYEIFKHNLEMSNHIYPNPGVYLPLMTDGGNYVFSDPQGTYYTVPIDYTTNIPEDWFQVCMSPEDIKLVQTGGYTGFGQLEGLLTADYDPAMGLVPWGVDAGDCVIIGGDGQIMVAGTTHIYNTTWSGVYLGLEIEKQMTLADKLRFYVQLGFPNYSAEGIWPNRTDWQQSPSFLDEGNNGAYSYRAEMEYNYKLSERMQLALKVDTNYFYVGKIPGELYVAETSAYSCTLWNGGICEEWLIETIPAHTQKISDSLKNAVWQSFGMYLGLKYAF